MKVCWLLALLGLCMPTAGGTTPVLTTEKPHAFFLVGSDSSFLRLDAFFGVRALWRLESTPALANLIPHSSHWDGAPIEAAAYSKAWQRLLLVIPKEARTDEQGMGEYRLVSVRLPDLLFVNAVDIPGRFDKRPSLLMNPAGQRLFIETELPARNTASGEEVLASTVSVRDVRTLKEVALYRWETTTAKGGLLQETAPIFTDKAYFYGSENRIVSKNEIIEFAEGRYKAKKIDYLSGLSADSQERLKPFEQRIPVSKKLYVDSTIVDSQAGQALVEVSSPKQLGLQAMYLVDVDSGKAGKVVETPRSRLYMLADGKTVVAQEIKARRPKNKTFDEFTNTGRILIYDMAEGKLRQEIRDPALAGESVALTCTSADGNILFFRSANSRLLVIDLPSAKAKEMQVEFYPDGTACIELESEDAR